jgi:hypothetical protein
VRAYEELRVDRRGISILACDRWDYKRLEGEIMQHTIRNDDQLPFLLYQRKGFPEQNTGKILDNCLACFTEWKFTGQTAAQFIG